MPRHCSQLLSSWTALFKPVHMPFLDLGKVCSIWHLWPHLLYTDLHDNMVDTAGPAYVKAHIRGQVGRGCIFCPGKHNLRSTVLTCGTTGPAIKIKYVKSYKAYGIWVNNMNPELVHDISMMVELLVQAKNMTNFLWDWGRKIGRVWAYAYIYMYV